MKSPKDINTLEIIYYFRLIWLVKATSEVFF